MAVEQDVRQASDRFYAALNQLINGDAQPILSAISQRADVTVMHPIGGRQVGRDEVVASMQQIAQAVSAGKVELADPLVVRLTDDVAYTLGTERAEATIGPQPVRFESRATNVYRRESGEWKLVHHHVDLAPAAVEAVTRLMAGASGGPSA